MKAYKGILIVSAIAWAIITAGFIYLNTLYGAIAGGIGLVSLLVTLFFLISHSHKQQALMDQVFAKNRSAAYDIINDISVPSLLVDSKMRIAWRNEAFKAIYDGKDLLSVFPKYNQNAAAQQTVILGKNYQVMSIQLDRGSVARSLTFQYWLDRTEAAHYQRLYTEQMPYVMLVYVDNYEELTGDIQVQKSAVLAETERLVSELCRRHGGVYRRYENGRFLCIFEAQQVSVLEQNGFELMERVRKIDTGTSVTVSLSIAVGKAPRLNQSEEAARSAMELALGRGGDQAVVKEGTSYQFYGGKNQKEANQSRVKTRLFSKALHQLFENTGDVFVMGHKHSDMDCIGAALGIITCANHLGSNGYLILDASNVSIEDALRHIQKDASLSRCIVTPDQAMELLRPNSVLVVVDTQRASTTVSADLIDKFNHLVLIDHHRRSADYIETATLHLLESRASSASEMVTEVMQYFADGVRPSGFTCSALLAGISVDTKQFAFNVGSRTYEAAGYLRRHGADQGMVKQMFQNDLKSFVCCARTVENAQIRPSGIAISLCQGDTADSKLSAAQASDALLDIKGVIAAFVLGEDGDSISISGRSYGVVNVQVILEKLGGGGHLTMAGAQLRGVTMQQALSRLTECVEQYEQAASIRG